MSKDHGMVMDLDPWCSHLFIDSFVNNYFAPHSYYSFDIPIHERN